MATVYWLGVDGNLSNVANYSSGALPANGDDFVIDRGTIDITSNLTALSARTLKSWSVTPGFKGNIGTFGTSITINVTDASATTMRVAMGGQYIYWTGTFSGSGSITVGSTGTGIFYMTGGSFSGKTFVGGQTGKVIIASGVTMGDVYSAGVGFVVRSAFSNALLMAGNHTMEADVTNLTLGANTACTLEGTGVDVSNAYLHNGSQLTLNNGGATAGIVSNANAYPGSTIRNGGKYDNTITTLYQWAGSNQTLNAAAAVTSVGTTTPVGVK